MYGQGNELWKAYKQIMAETKDIESLFWVGSNVMVIIGLSRRNSSRYVTAMRGWRKGSHIILDRPKVSEGSFVALQEGLRCTIQFIREGMACSFEAEVIDWDNRRFNPCVRFSWPTEVRSASFRRFDRVNVNMPCTLLRDGVQSEGNLSDVSMGGGSVLVNRAFPAGTMIEMSFTLPDGCVVNQVKAVVRSVHAKGALSIMGCEFLAEQEMVENDIAFYVMMALAALRGDAQGSTAGLRVLVLEHEAARLLDIRQAFEKAGFGVFVAGNLVDGMYRLRLSGPAAVLINQGFADIAGVEVCRIIKRSPDFSQVPVYVFGGRESGLVKDVFAAGGAQYFPESTGMFNAMAHTLAQQWGLAEAAKELV